MRGVATLAAVGFVSMLMLFVGPAQAATTFVQDQRVNSLALAYTPDVFAPHDAFGTAIVGNILVTSAQSAIATSIANGVADGSTSWVFEMEGLTDLSGTSDASFTLGVLTPTPVAGSGYDGTSDLDWWYLPDASQFNPDGSAKEHLSASLTNGMLSAGPGGNLDLPINFLGTPLTLALSDVKIQAEPGAASKPLSSTGSPPGHLASEYIDPNLTSFGSMSAGELSGNISAASLAATPVPAVFGQSFSCQSASYYTALNSLLDVFVGGCRNAIETEINPTQPDTVTSTGSGTYHFNVDPLSHQVTSCTQNGGPATLSDCLAGAAYSTDFKFTTDRVIDQLKMADGKLLSVNHGGSGSGSVSGPGINCGPDCSEPYDAGTQVQVTATPSAGSVFAGWTGCDSPSGTTCTMTMGADKSVTATFVTLRKLTVTLSGAGRVSSTPAGIVCGTTCTASYKDGTQVTLTETAKPGSYFAHWSGNCNGIVAATCELAMSADHTAIAVFAAGRPPLCHVPAVKGKTLAAATTAINNVHCAVGTIQRVYSATVAGHVISQLPASGTAHPYRTKVNLKVSLGAKP
jgi:hypothetical protein